VAAQIDKSPEGLFLYLGAIRAGFSFLPLNTAYQAAELAYFLDNAAPEVVVCRPEAGPLVQRCAEEAHVRHVFTLGSSGEGTLAEACKGAPASFHDVSTARDRPAVIIYTSGTTGRSKGALLTHHNLTSNADVLTDHWQFTSDDVLIHALPTFHVHGLFVALHPVLCAGAKLSFHRRFEPQRVLAALARATVLMGVPTFYTRLLGEAALSRESCKTMRLFVSGSAPLSKETFDAFFERTGFRILERYGMSEAGMITSNPYVGERRAGTVGLPLPGVSLRIVDERGRELPPGQVGDIEIRGPNVFTGYFRMPEKAREDFTADGYFRTGDVGQKSPDGYVTIVGRSKDIVITGGYNVYPKEVELAIDAFPEVLESAVIGVGHHDLGEAVTAVVVLREGCELSEPELVARLKSAMASYKVPKRVHFVRELPRNAMGKVEKRLLREKVAG
jgi:malonyl-CoA/methylmalonyl-CoA synthetase